ncbi:isoleucine--tRNA ligase [Candidatus Gracilibacteria bacterium 28_42_T64]|nr:isoleucine--tRNA ligase [Candidatus Gracilibacteria bacterium 28_42_T64]
MTNFKKVNPKQSFPKLEEGILKFWEENKIFEQSIENRKDSEEFNFYDGPPFATGTPHYGHILAGTIKDVIPRYQTMKGKQVHRKFGWDCHGLPIENIVEKKLEISGKDDIEGKIGVHKFNETCRENVFTYANEWKKTVNRMGRWVDMENDYKTMDTDFMESVWWVYSELYKKGLIYEGYRVVPYCPRCSTPLSNFEVNQGYKDVQDKTATVKFKVQGNESKYILAWTTTPWTLVANLGLAVGVDIDYVELLDHKTEETYIMARDRISAYYKNEDDYVITREYKGKCLEGIKYDPLFMDFQTLADSDNMPQGMNFDTNTYSVVIGHHVTTESGTGIVHIAPAYGEDDYQIGKNEKLGFVSHIADNGNTENLLENNGVQVFDFNELVIEALKKQGSTLQINTYDHSYPHCWRCESPLMYRAISAWYVAVEKIRDRMVKNNQEINWTPNEIKDGRFGKWVENARDWNISRNRYWGSAIPVWQNEDKTTELCIGSIKEMYELNKEYGQIEEKTVNGEIKYFYTNSGEEVDIHKHFVDEIFLKDPKTGEKLKRIPEVLDCWFESGSMPYASKHYPFDTKSDFKFPADFIAEGLDQTRGWFYTLLILGTALFDKAPMKNVIVNGIILAEDGQKMSKSKQNYPDPTLVFDKYGADAMRFYLMNSPVVEAQDFRFAEAGIEEVVKKVILPLWNTYYFFTTYANIDNFESKGLPTTIENNLDKWLLSELNTLTKQVSNGFDSYKLADATKPIVKFMDNLTNWYIRRSRKRFWKTENDGDKLQAYETLNFVLVETTKIIAPFMPFISEYMYKDLTGDKSVHLTDFPTFDSNLIDEKLNTHTAKIQKIITLGLAWRANNKLRVRQPLKSITITETFDNYYIDIIKEELNVKEVLVVDGNTLAKQVCKPNGRAIGPKFGKDVKFIMTEAKSGNFELLENGDVKVGHFELSSGDFELVFEAGESGALIEAGFGMVIAMDENITDELRLEGYYRDIVRHIQESRKEADYRVDDRIQVSLEGADDILAQFQENIESETLSTVVESLDTTDIDKKLEIGDLNIIIKLKK